MRSMGPLRFPVSLNGGKKAKRAHLRDIRTSGISNCLHTDISTCNITCEGQRPAIYHVQDYLGHDPDHFLLLTYLQANSEPQVTYVS